MLPAPPPPSYSSTVGSNAAVGGAPADAFFPPPPTYQGGDGSLHRMVPPQLSQPIRHHHTCSFHSRTSSATSASALMTRSPVHEGVAHRSQDDILNTSGSQQLAPGTVAYFENGGSGDPRYLQLLTEYRRLLSSVQSSNDPSTPGNHHGIHHGRAPSWSRLPPAGEPPHWHSPPTPHAPPLPQAPSTPTSAAAPDPSSTLSAPSSPMPSFAAANRDAPSAPAVPATKSAQPLTPLQKAGAAKLAAPPQSSGAVVRKVSKRQLEAEEENMTKDAKIAHLERLLQLKDERLAKLEGEAPEMLDSACQATVWTNSIRTQTDEGVGSVAEGGDEGRGSGSPSSSDTQSGMKRNELQELQSLMVECGFTTLRPLTIQLFGVDNVPTSSSLVALPAAAASAKGSAQDVSQFTSPSPRPRWAHCPYPLTKKNSTGQMSTGETSQGEASMVELLAPLPSNHRWADDPCELELQPASSMNSGTTAPLSPHVRLGNSTSNAPQKVEPSTISRAGSVTGAAWRGGSRVQARQGSAQTL